MKLPDVSSKIIAQDRVNLREDPRYYDSTNDVMTLRGLEGVFANIVRVVIGLGAIALFIMLLIGGFNYITAGGDPKKSAAARATITHALLGITLIASAYMIIRIIDAVTGVDLSTFRIYQP